MQLISQLFKIHLDIIFFIYGLSFVILGVAILVQTRQESKYKIAGILWILAVFALVHGLNEFLDMWAIIKGRSLSLDIGRWLALLISYVFLFEFGRQLFYLTRPENSFFRKKMPVILSKCLPWACAVTIIFISLSSSDFLAFGGIFSRYLLGLPGCLLIGFGLFAYYRFEENILAAQKIRPYFLIASLAFISYGILGGLFVPRAGFFPANLLNNDTFYAVVRIPVQVFRAIFAVIATLSFLRILKIFNQLALIRKFKYLVENINDGIFIVDINKTVRFVNSIGASFLGALAEDLEGKSFELPIRVGQAAEVSIHLAFDKLGIAEIQAMEVEWEQKRALLVILRDITARKISEAELRRASYLQSSLNKLLKLSLEDIPLQNMLEQVIDNIIAIPWFALEARGAIFLTGNDPRELVIRAHRGLSSALVAACSRIPFGKCLCGKAAKDGATVFADCVNQCHEIAFDNMKPHGHYCVPIISADKVIGVINLYVTAGHKRDTKEDDFLKSSANLIAGIIERKKSEEQIQVLNAELEQRVELRTAELKSAYEELKKLDQVKSDFISMVSHELRTPLSIIKEGVALIFTEVVGHISQKQKNILDMVSSGINRLARLINDLLDLSKIEAGNVELKKNLADITAIVRDCEIRWRPEAGNKHQELTVVLPESSVNLYISPDRILQVIDNLISNAVKFTPENGKIKLELADKKDRVEITVSDNGPGIAKENFPKVFERFQQFSRTVGPGAKGTGLGLAISKQLVEIHKGGISFESELDKGSKFTFWLPKVDNEAIFNESVNSAIKEAALIAANLSLINIRLDGIEEFRKTSGDEAAEKLFLEIKRLLEGCLRRLTDKVLIGVNEAQIILFDTGKAGAVVMRAKIEHSLREYLKDKGPAINRLNFNIGMAIYPDEAMSAEELLLKARQAKPLR